MNHIPYADLQATPDFSAFQFASPTPTEPIIRQVRFSNQKNSRIYQLDLRDQPDGEKEATLRLRDCGDMNRVLATLIQIIEIYTERYPMRIIRLKGNTFQKVLLYHTALDEHMDLIRSLFTIEVEKKDIEVPFGRAQDVLSFLLKRKPIPYVSIHSIESTWSGLSRLFENRFSIELNKSIRVGLTMPAI